MRYLRLGYFISLLLPTLAFADPLDKGEAYTMRDTPPDWMDAGDFAWLLVDYGVFAIIIAAIGWIMFKHPQQFARFERTVLKPMSFLFEQEKKYDGVVSFAFAMIAWVSVFIFTVSWVFFCQWLGHLGLGAVSMAGLALEAVLIVRALRDSESVPSVSRE